MKLKITVPNPNGHVVSGAAAHVFLDDVDVSKYTSRVELVVDASDAISAKVTFFLTDIEMELPADVQGVVDVATTRRPLGGWPVRKSA